MAPIRIDLTSKAVLADHRNRVPNSELTISSHSAISTIIIMFYSPDILKRKEGFSVIWYLCHIWSSNVAGWQRPSAPNRLWKSSRSATFFPSTCLAHVLFSPTETNLSHFDWVVISCTASPVFSANNTIFSMVSASMTWLRLADVNIMHTRIRRETLLFNALNTGALLDESPVKVSPRKYTPRIVS